MSQATVDRAIDQILEMASQRRLDLEVLATARRSTGISFQKRKMDKFNFSETRQLGVRVLDGKHEGVAYTESLDPESLEGVIEEALSNARVIRREWVAELKEKAPLPEMKELYNPALDRVDPAAKIKTAAALEARALDFDPRIQSVAYSGYGDGRAESWIANTRGLRGSYATNVCYGYARCLANDGPDGKVMSGDHDMARDFSELNTKRIAETAARKTLERLGATRPRTGVYSVVFENRVAEKLIGAIANYFSAKAVDEKTSPLSDKMGQAVFAPNLTIVDDPFYAGGAGARPFDDEGYPSMKTPLVQQGRLVAFLSNSALARKMKLAHTASGARSPSSDLDVSSSNLIVTPGRSTLAELLAADSKTILITELMGMAGFRATSGDFSIPVEGFLYEGGKRVAPLKDFLISGNILQLFQGIEGLGNDVLAPLGTAVSPSLLVRGMNVAGRA